MQCKDAQALLNIWIDNELPADKRNEIEHHLTLCGACAREAQEMRDLSRCLDTHQIAQPSPDLTKRTMSLFSEASSGDRGFGWLSSGWQMPAAMTVGALIGLGVGCHLGGHWTCTQLLDQYSISGFFFSAGDLLLSWA